MTILRKISKIFHFEEEAEKRLSSFLKEHPALPEDCLYAPFFRFQFLATGNPPFLLNFPFLPGNESDHRFREAADGAVQPYVSLKEAANLKDCPEEEKLAFLEFLLSLFPPRDEVPAAVLREMKEFAILSGIPENDWEKQIQEDTAKRRERRDLMTSGTGLLAALAVILLMILAALYVKTAFFGFLLAFLFLPLERFFERRLFGTKAYRIAESILLFPLRQILKLKTVLTRHKPRITDQEKARRATLSAKASAATIFVLLGVVFLILSALIHVLTPRVIETGKELAGWAKKTSVVQSAEAKLGEILQKKNAEQAEQNGGEEGSSNFAVWVRQKLHSYMKENPATVAEQLLERGGDVLQFLLAVARMIGIFAFDLVLTLFFFYVFLQKMAFYSNAGTAGEKKSEPISVGTWAVGALFGSAWFPDTAVRTKEAAAGILDHVSLMFTSWLRGYFCIIIIEMPLYICLFTLFSVPYALPLAMLSSCTVLLPVLGLLAAVTLTVVMTLVFGVDGQTTFTLVGIAITYLSVNTLLEQFFLYPTLVGGAIGLSTVETIIVVLLGALLGGVTGMIVAVPAAAVIKYLVPKIYLALAAAVSRKNGDVLKTGRKLLRPD